MIAVLDARAGVIVLTLFAIWLGFVFFAWPDMAKSYQGRDKKRPPAN